MLAYIVFMKKTFGTNVLVTGASSGIGKSIAELFAKNGYTVYAISRSIEECTIDMGMGRLRQIRCDVTDEDSILALRACIDKLSIIIHAAGCGIAGSAEDVDAALARKQLEVNYLGPIAINHAFLPLLRENERSLIIFISSIAGRIPIPFQSHYSSSKYALEAYAEALDMEARPFGVRTVLLEPGDTKTGFTSRRQKYIPDDSPYKAAAEKAISRMERDEMNGKSPETVARIALKAASRRNPPVRKPIGIMYSMLMILPRILPQKLIHRILMAMY